METINVFPNSVPSLNPLTLSMCQDAPIDFSKPVDSVEMGRRRRRRRWYGATHRQEQLMVPPSTTLISR